MQPTMLPAVISGLAMRYVCLGKMIFKETTPKLDLVECDVGMVVLNVCVVLVTRVMLIKQGDPPT